MVYAGGMDKHTAQAAMLIGRPIDVVFDAFTGPAITSKFWFSHGSDVLREAGQRATWRWDGYGFESPVEVLEITLPSLLRVRWGEEDEASVVTWRFTARDAGCFVEIENSGFNGDDASKIAQLRDSTEGFAFVLAGAKAWLEQGVQFNLVPDHHTDLHKDS